MKGVHVCRAGVTRLVVLIGPWAVKLPRFGYGWRAGLNGLLANMQEVAFARTGWPELCPVLFSLPGGFLVIQRRVRMLSRAEWQSFDPMAFCQADADRLIPAEHKIDSFGLLDGRVVAVDYGS